MLIQSPQLLYKLSDSLQKNNQLAALVQQFEHAHQLTPCFGVEIEFYLSDNINIAEFETKLGLKVKAEKGKNQFEIDLPPSCYLPEYAAQVSEVKNKIVTVALSLEGSADIRAKPFMDDYGNSMHFHLNFLSSQDENLTERLAKILCHYMLGTFLIFLPKEDDYARLDGNYMAPTHVSYGGNNRSVAVRIPDILPKRVEHRVSSISADPYLVMYAILKSVLLGLESPSHIPNYPKIYGNAFDPQYNLTPLPRTRGKAAELFETQLFL